MCCYLAYNYNIYDFDFNDEHTARQVFIIHMIRYKIVWTGGVCVCQMSDATEEQNGTPWVQDQCSL